MAFYFIPMDWKEKVHEIIYEADTKEGKLFDVILLWVILLSIILVMLESVQSIQVKYAPYFDIAEWVITILFLLEYIARIVVVKKPFSYIFSFYGVIDFVSIIPKFLSYLIVGSNFLVAIRALRLLRVFRVLKLGHYLGASNNLIQAIKSSRQKIAVFMFIVLILCVILGTVMYVIEGEKSGFTSIPVSIYWAIVTLTTVGYGDIAPLTPFGQLIASVVMILGYSIIAIPTGIVSSELTKETFNKSTLNTQACQTCSAEGHKSKAKFCYKCGHDL